MALRVRLGRESDLEQCCELLWPGDSIGFERAELPRFWRLCLDLGAYSVVEAIHRHGERTLAGFGLSVFVTDALIDSLFASTSARLSAQFYHALERDPSVLLTERQLAAANAGDGVNALVLHFGSRYTDFADSRTIELLAAGSAAFFAAHGGYRLRSLLFECFGPDSRQFLENGQFHVLRDHAQDPNYSHLPPTERPSICGLRREWVQPSAVSPFMNLFFTPAPRIYFSKAERRILEHALLNATDEEIATALDLSVDTVKKTWRRILERAVGELPGLFSSGNSATGVRGREKRRELLNYVRTHPQEIRPYRL
jgi:DNA-binding CsgD family transcriptional regulator